MEFCIRTHLIDMNVNLIRLLLLVLFSVCFNFLPAQHGELNFSRINDDFLWNNSSSAERDSVYFGLPIIEYSAYSIHIRFSWPGYRIDFFGNHKDSLQGILINEIQEYRKLKKKWGGQERPFRYVWRSMEIDSGLSKLLGKEILASNLESIPPDSMIPSWNRFMHCESLNIKAKVYDTYSEQHWHCPWSQPDTVPFSNIIVQNYQLLFDSLKLEKRYRDFENLLPRGKSYSRNGYRVMYKFTEQESELWKKGEPRRYYLKSGKDTIDQYIKTELSKTEMEDVGIDCSGRFLITIGMNGKLKKVQTFPGEEPKVKDGIGWYLEDAWEDRQCRRQIRKMLKSADLGFLDLEYEVERTISFWTEGNVYLEDNNLY